MHLISSRFAFKEDLQNLREKAKDIDGYSSFIEQIKTEGGYPHVEEARDKAGTLKISNASIGDAMMRMAVHLQSIV